MAPISGSISIQWLFRWKHSRLNRYTSKILNFKQKVVVSRAFAGTELYTSQRLNKHEKCEILQFVDCGKGFPTLRTEFKLQIMKKRDTRSTKILKLKVFSKFGIDFWETSESYFKSNMKLPCHQTVKMNKWNLGTVID